MKKSLLLILGIYCFFLHAQIPFKLETFEHSFLPNDSLYKYQVVYKDPGGSGQKQIWDFSNLKIIDKNYKVKYFRPDKKDTTEICCLEHRTRYYYRCKSDSLWSLGFENYTTTMNYTKPELKLKYPFTYGETLQSTFEGKGMYSNLFALSVKGYTFIKADGEGELKLPEEKKIKNALRLHTIRHYSEIGRDSIEMTLDTYTWYTKDVRYPVFETVKTTLHKVNKDNLVFYTSFYYSPEEHKLEKASDEELADLDSFDDSKSEIEKVITELFMIPNPVVNNLNIEYKLSRKADVWFAVHNNIGIPMCMTSPKALNEGQYAESIRMGHLSRGTYIVYVHVDNMVLKRVVVKK